MEQPEVVHGPVSLPLRTPGRETGYELWYFSFGGQRWVAACCGPITDGAPVPLRIESACLFGHVLHSAKCDCGYQLDEALRRIAELGRGVVVYGVDQDARGLGIEAHFRIYVMRQRENLDTDAVYERLGAPVDARTYEPVAVILRHLGVQRVRLLSNNPSRKRFLEESGFAVEVEALEAPLDVHNMSTLMLEKEDLGYTWSFKTHGDWLQSLQQRVVHDPDTSAAQLVRGQERPVALYEDRGEWSCASGLAAAADGQAAPRARDMTVYLTDLPRVDELPVYGSLGAYFVVVPFPEIPRYLRDAEAAAGVRLQDWGRRQNRYQEPRPQWSFALAEGGRHWYVRDGAVRVVFPSSTRPNAAVEAFLAVYADALAAAGDAAPVVSAPRGRPLWADVRPLSDAGRDLLRQRGFRVVELPGTAAPWVLTAVEDAGAR
jgi:GTP cyclohydrolase II